MTNFALSGGHEETLRAASEILRSGGNAFDAAISAYVTSFVSEPAMSSAGGGGFAICHQEGRSPLALDFFSATPIKNPMANLDIAPVEVHFGDETEVYYAGLGTMAIPGAVRGIFHMHRSFGSMPIKELFFHAIELCKNGIALNNFQHLDLNLLKNIFIRNEYGRKIFFDGTEVKSIGSIIQMEQLGDFLETLSIEGEELFYRGEVGRQLISDCQEKGGAIDSVSLSSYKSILARPISCTIAAGLLHTIGYPSMGGALLLHLANEIQADNPPVEFRSSPYTNYMCDLLKRGKELHDNPVELFRRLNLSYPIGDNRHGSTSHFNIVDRDLNAVSLTMTIGEGSGYFIPKTGIHMNNMLGEPALLPNGINSWLPNTRMRSMMTPTIITDKNHSFKLSLGTGGAARIPFMIGQVLQAALFEDHRLREAIERPRMYFDGSVMHIEDGADLDLTNFPNKFHLWKDKSLFFGGVHAVELRDGKLNAVGDARRDGVRLLA